MRRSAYALTFQDLGNANFAMDQPGRHYPDLYAICTDIAEHLAQQIDHTGGATAAT